MKLALSTFPEASTRTLIRILMVPLIVFCADLETTGETLQNAARIGVGGGCRTPRGRCHAKAAALEPGAHCAFLSRGLTASAGADSALARRPDLRSCNGFRGTGEFEETELAGCASEEGKAWGR